jgi:hypothetical protein
MVPERYQLAAVGRYLLDQFELRRPGLKAWTPEVAASFREQAEREIQQMEKQLHELGIDDAQYWQRLRRAVDDIVLPRYGKIAQEEIDLARREYGLWRGGDLLARVAFAGAGLVLGIICVELPYIPIQARWFPVVPFLLGPIFPDIVTTLYSRRYRNRMNKIVSDLKKANESLDTYRPLSELAATMEPRTETQSELMEAPPFPGRERS